MRRQQATGRLGGKYLASWVGRLLLGMGLALVGIQALAAGMGVADAQHLLWRTGFGATPAEVQGWARLTRQQAVDRLLAEHPVVPVTPLPAWAQAPVSLPILRDMSVEERKAYQQLQRDQYLELSDWWLTEMLETSSPLTERMTLFWHNHFVSARNKVKAAELLNQQNQLFRQQALGNFGTLLHAVARDPAMMIYLDAATNRKASPNENFAREVMELFTLGVGHYTEQDVKEAARAFTGWTIDRRSGEVKFLPAQYDGGMKTVLGRSGNLDMDDVLDTLLAQPETAVFVVRKLWREFVAEEMTPADEREIQHIAEVFRDSGYEISTALRGILLSEAFYAPEHRAALIKSPVDVVVGTLHTLEINVTDARPLVLALRQLGQELFNPPNVKGWPGGENWINASTLLGRKAFIDRLLRAEEMPPGTMMATLGVRDRMMDGRRPHGNLRFDVASWIAGIPAGEHVQSMLLVAAPVTQPTAPPDSLALIRQLMLDPAYQLK